MNFLSSSIALIGFSATSMPRWQLYVVYLLLVGLTTSLSFWGFQHTQKQKASWLGQLLIVLSVIVMVAGLFSLANSLDKLGDFTKAYYPAGKLVLENPQKLYESNLQGRLGGFVNIPIIAYLFTPFSLLDPFYAHLLFTVSGIAVAIASYFAFVEWLQVKGWIKWLILQLFIINGPLYYSILVGNTTQVLLLLFVFAFSLLEKKRDFWVGFVVAIAALIKVPIILFGVYFFLRRQWQTFIGFLVPAILVPGLSILIFGFNLHVEWYQRCIKPFSGKALAAYNNQSVNSFVIRLFTTNPPEWYPLDMDLSARILKYLLFSILIGGTIWVCWRSKSPQTVETKNLELCIVLTLALITSPISWSHYYSLLLLPYGLYIAGRLGSFKERNLVIPIALSLFLISLPVIRATVANSFVNLLISKVLISYYFYAGVLLLGTLLFMRYQLRTKS